MSNSNQKTAAQRKDSIGKLCNPRHKHHSKRGCNAVEKAIETRVRQEGKREAQQRDY